MFRVFLFLFRFSVAFVVFVRSIRPRVRVGRTGTAAVVIHRQLLTSSAVTIANISAQNVFLFSLSRGLKQNSYYRIHFQKPFYFYHQTCCNRCYISTVSTHQTTPYLYTGCSKKRIHFIFATNSFKYNISTSRANLSVVRPYSVKLLESCNSLPQQLSQCVHGKVHNNTEV